MLRSKCRSETFRRNQRSAGLRDMVIRLSRAEVHASDRLQAHLDLASGRQAMWCLISALRVPGTAMPPDAADK
jgi:hypothetical protein